MSEFLETKSSTYLISNELKPCFECGKTTNRIDIYSEQYFCSDECMNKFDRRLVVEIETMYG